MKIDEIKDLVKKHGLLIIAVAIFQIPIIWYSMSFIFKERIDTLNATIKFLETKVSQYSTSIASQSSLSGNLVGEPDSNGDSSVKQSPILYPAIGDPLKLTKTEVRQLSEFYNLFNTWKVNPHLRFKDGDISYWYEQGLSEDQLKLEFESRRIVFERAEQSGQIFDTQGDLSFHAQQIQSQILRTRRGS